MERLQEKVIGTLCHSRGERMIGSFICEVSLPESPPGFRQIHKCGGKEELPIPAPHRLDGRNQVRVCGVEVRPKECEEPSPHMELLEDSYASASSRSLSTRSSAR